MQNRGHESYEWLMNIVWLTVISYSHNNWLVVEEIRACVKKVEIMLIRGASRTPNLLPVFTLALLTGIKSILLMAY